MEKFIDPNSWYYGLVLLLSLIGRCFITYVALKAIVSKSYNDFSFTLWIKHGSLYYNWYQKKLAIKFDPDWAKLISENKPPEIYNPCLDPSPTFPDTFKPKGNPHPNYVKEE